MLRRLVVCGLLGALACKGKAPPAPTSPPRTGLAAIPAGVTMVAQVDVARVLALPELSQIFIQVLQRDAELMTRWQAVADACKLAARSMQALSLASKGGAFLLVVDGSPGEAEASKCIRAAMGANAVQSSLVGGRRLYHGQREQKHLWFGFTAGHTMVLSSSESLAKEALLGESMVAPAGPLLQFRATSQTSAAWAVAMIEPAIGAPFVKLVGAAPDLIAIDLATQAEGGLMVEWRSQWPSNEAAAQFGRAAKVQLGLLAIAAQAKQLGKIVGKISTSEAARIVTLNAVFGVEDLKLLRSLIDSAAVSDETAPPVEAPTGSKPPAQ